jgi:hypothetical protein
MGEALGEDYSCLRRIGGGEEECKFFLGEPQHLTPVGCGDGV